MSGTRLVLTLHADGLEIPVEVTRKHVKNLNLRVRGDQGRSHSAFHSASPSPARRRFWTARQAG